MVRFLSNDRMRWLEFDLLSDCQIKHAVFFRNGGISPEPFDSLNFESRVGDTENHVRANIRKACKVLDLERLASLQQCHGDTIVEAEENSHIPLGDVLTTNRPEWGLLIKHGDCQAAIVYDPICRAVANVHCGWRGNVQNIYAKTIQWMKQKYGSKPENLLVCIGPSLGPAHAEFIHYKQEFPESFWQFQWQPFYFDLWALSRWQLKSNGILDNHIEIAMIDTYLDQGCFSYRKNKVTGRCGTMVSLNQMH